MRRETRVALVAVALLGTGLVSGCEKAQPTELPGSDHGMQSLPNQSLSDLVSYSDVIVVATVVSEREASSDVDPGDSRRYIGRALTFRVDHRVWSSAGAPQPGAEFELTTYGWNQTAGGSRKPSLRRDVIWYQKGDQYVIPLSRYEDGSLAIPSVDSIVPMSTTAVFGAGQPWVASTPALSALTGKTPAELAETLKAVQPDPIAIEYRALNPSTRYQKVLAESSTRSR